MNIFVDFYIPKRKALIQVIHTLHIMSNIRHFRRRKRRMELDRMFFSNEAISVQEVRVVD